MNATATATLDALRSAGEAGYTIGNLQDVLGRSETTVRKALKELGELVAKNDEGAWVAVVEEPAAEEPTAKKKYRRHAKPTTRTVRVNQITKTEVQVIRGDEDPKGVDLDETEYDGSKWATVCITHKQAAGFDLVLDAHYASSYPTFCTECAPKLEGKVGRRRAAVEAQA